MSKLSYAPSASAPSMPSSKRVTGEFLDVGRGAIEFTELAWITRELANTSLWKAKVSVSRDISDAINAHGHVLVRDIVLEYERGDTSTMFPIADVIVEHRPNIGKVIRRKGPGGKSSFESGYLVTYASVGIPESVFNAILEKIRLASTSSTMEPEKVTHHDGYAWMPMKLPSEDKIIVHGVDDKGSEVEIGPLADLVSESGWSILGYGAVTFRMKQSRARGAPPTNKFSLAATISALQAVDLTRLSSPPLLNKARGMMVNKQMSQGLLDVLASITPEGREEEEEEDEGEEKEKAEDQGQA